MTKAKFIIIGVYQSVIDEILASQSNSNNEVHLLQPHSEKGWPQFDNAEMPTDLYLTVTSDLNHVHYKCTILKCLRKSNLSQIEIDKYNSHLEKNQHEELTITKQISKEDPFEVLIEMKSLEPLAFPKHISGLIKESDNKPMKERTRSGGHSKVYESDLWVNEKLENENNVKAKLDQAVQGSNNLTLEQARQKALKSQDSKSPPKKQWLKTKGYVRNPDVIRFILARANGVCENCKETAPFKKKKDNQPYLEVHHKKMLSEGGKDTIENTIALCPNCHREMHFGV